MKKHKVTAATTTCPVCQSDWQGPEIEKDYRDMFSGRTHYSRLVSIYDRDLDMTVAWECPDCHHRFRREK